MGEEQEKQVENKPERDEHGHLLPGNTANPAGRPKKNKAWKDILDELLGASEVKLFLTVGKDEKAEKKEIILSIGEEKTIRHALTVRQIQLALSGDMDAIKDLMNRDIGMPKQAIDHTSQGERIDLSSKSTEELIEILKLSHSMKNGN